MSRHDHPLATLVKIVAVAVLVSAGTVALAAGADLGQAQKQPTNWTAIGMFAAFVLLTLGITKWAAARTKSAADFYTAGGGITGFQNGLAIAGDYMSAASFLGISAAVMASGFDGLIFSIGWLVGWPVITFLMAERLRNLGKFTFADVASFRFAQTPVRIFAAFSTLVVVARFLALLELFRDKAVSFDQLSPLGDLAVHWTAGSGDWSAENLSEEFEEQL